MKRKHLLIDFTLLLASIVLAVAIVRLGWVHALLGWAGDGVLLASFVAGMFFTSLMTTAPALAVLGELAQEGNLFLVAVVGGMGAVVGDYIIFAFVRDRIADDIAYLLRRTGTPRFFKLFHRRTLRWALPFIGALIIASPFPDELGLALLGLSKMSTVRFVLISFIFNATGILLIGLAARSLAV